MNKLILMLPLTAALITACGGGGSTSVPSGGSILVPIGFKQPESITGIVLNYSGGAATIEALAVSTAPKSASNPAVASTALNANGSFNLQLPPQTSIAPYLSAPGSAASAVYTETGCSGSLSNSTPEAQGYSIGALSAAGVNYSTFTTVRNQSARTVTVDGGSWFYTTKATSLGGSITCLQSANGQTEVLRVSANAPLNVGWNFMKLHADGAVSSDGSVLTINLTFVTANDQATSWSTVSASPLSVNPLAATVTARLGSFHFGALHF